MLKNGLLLFATAFFFILFVGNTNAQRRFKAGFLLGLNASQILGDDVGGYNKLGIQGGLRGTAVLKDRMDVSMELLYSQRGSYQKQGLPGSSAGSLKINLQYVEVPVVFSYKDWLEEEEGYYKVQASIGLAYSRLLKATANGSKHDDLADTFNTDDFGFTVGADYFTSENLSFGVRWSKSLNLLYNKDKHDPGRNSLRGFFLSFRSAYIF
jgi:outer membrane protein with beta-barrel domain